MNDPLETMLAPFDNSPATSFVRDVHAMASASVDWRETPAEHIFQVDLPGLKTEEMLVRIEDGRTLSISGQRSMERVQTSDTWHRVERIRGQFLRKFKLPENTILDRIRAKLENGVLTVTVPKFEARSRIIQVIEVGGDQPGSIQILAIDR